MRKVSFSEEERRNWSGPYLESKNLDDVWGYGVRYAYPPLRNTGERKYEWIEKGKKFLIPNGTRYTIAGDGRRIAIYPDKVDVWSLGPDGVGETADDIGNWDSFTMVAGDPVARR